MADLGVVVIGRNEGARLARALASAAGAGPLVYVDSGSTDGSVALARAQGVPVLELSADRPFSAARARNEGFAALLAREPGLAFVQFLDGDCELAPGWLAAGRAALLARPAAALACGRLRERAPDASLYNRLCQVEWNAPPGIVDACGGVFLARADAFAAVGGMDPRVVAAEEDDLCVRLRLRGREILRTADDMATHDAAMERFGQWWRRSLRTGQAYAQVSALHRGAPLRPFAREARSALVFGLAVPLGILALAAAAGPAALLLFALYVPLAARVARRLRARGEEPRDAWLYAAHCYAAKLPQAAGVLRHAADRLRAKPARLIEHKGVGAERDAGGEHAFRVALLGAGYIADWHRRALRFVPEARIVAVCDRMEGRAAAAAAAAGAQAYASLADMLGAERLDAVHVLLPPDQHFAAAREILAAGVAVLLEKPMCTTEEECAELERIAQRSGVRLAVSHNFLFDPGFERLVHDVRTGRLGPLDALTVTWNRELPLLQNAPPGAWMLAAPGNIVLEIGSHLLAHVVEAAGAPRDLAVRADREIALPGGRRFLRRWRIEGTAGGAAVSIAACFAPGFPEYRVHARGALGAATADLERGTYTFERSSFAPADLARFTTAAATAAALAVQTARGVVDAVLAKAGARRPANPFEASIAGALRAFYAGLARPGELDPRIAAERGRTVVALGLAIGSAAGAPAGPLAAPAPRAARELDCETLVLGGNGFIGRALVRKLLADGAAVRVLSRTAAGLPEDPHGRLDVALGSRNDPAALDRALRGVRVVYDLARSQGPAWEDFVREDVEGARAVGERCLAHGVERLVYASTIDVYYAGAAGSTITEATPHDAQLARRNLYAQAKAAAERALLALQERGLPLVIARPGIVIGEGASPMHGGVGEWSGLGAVATYGAGDAALPLVLVDDCADALARMKDAPGLDGCAFNLVGPPLLTARGYLDALERAGGLALRRRARPIWRFFLADAAKWLVKVAVRHPGRSRRPSYRDFASRTFRARFECDAARATLGWSPCGDVSELVTSGIREPLRELRLG